MKAIVSLIFLLVSTIGLSKVDKIYYETTEGETVCLDPDKWMVIEKDSPELKPKIITKIVEVPVVEYRTKIIEKTIEKPVVKWKTKIKIVEKTVVKWKIKIVEKTVVKWKTRVKTVEKIVDETRKNTISVLTGFPVDYHNYELTGDWDKPVPAVMYTRTVGKVITISVGAAPMMRLGGVGYNF